MPAPYSGNPTGIQSPSPQPVGGGVPIVNIPVPGDRGADLWSQPLKAIADWIAFLAAQPLATPSGQLLNVRTFTSSSSPAKTAGTRRAHVRMVGGGGGGGGAGATTSSGGGGGSAGGYAEYFTTNVPAAWVLTVGAGGAGGLSVPTNGSPGGNTTFFDGTTLVTAFGGLGGDLNGFGGEPPSLSTNGTINGSGAPGGSQNRLFSGRGASSLMGGAGGLSVGGDFADHDGLAGVGFGAGGSGGYRYVNYRAGGAGTGGFIILEEYS